MVAQGQLRYLLVKTKTTWDEAAVRKGFLLLEPQSPPSSPAPLKPAGWKASLKNGLCDTVKQMTELVCLYLPSPSPPLHSSNKDQPKARAGSLCHSHFPDEYLPSPHPLRTARRGVPVNHVYLFLLPQDHPNQSAAAVPPNARWEWDRSVGTRTHYR